MSKYKNVTFGQSEAIINKLGGEEGMNKFLRGELIVSEPTSKWRYHAGIIYATFVSDGTTGAEWIVRLEKKGIILTNYAKSMLLSDDFKPTKGVSYEIAILPGGMWDDKNRTTKNIKLEASKRNLIEPNAETSCFIREMFSDKDIEVMGLQWILTMHEPIKNSGGGPSLLGTYRYGDGSCLDADVDGSDSQWFRRGGFAFVSSQVVL